MDFSAIFDQAAAGSNSTLYHDMTPSSVASSNIAVTEDSLPRSSCPYVASLFYNGHAANALNSRPVEHSATVSPAQPRAPRHIELSRCFSELDRRAQTEAQYSERAQEPARHLGYGDVMSSSAIPGVNSVDAAVHGNAPVYSFLTHAGDDTESSTYIRRPPAGRTIQTQIMREEQQREEFHRRFRAAAEAVAAAGRSRPVHGTRASNNSSEWINQVRSSSPPHAEPESVLFDFQDGEPFAHDPILDASELEEAMGNPHSSRPWPEVGASDGFDEDIAEPLDGSAECSPSSVRRPSRRHQPNRNVRNRNANSTTDRSSEGSPIRGHYNGTENFAATSNEVSRPDSGGSLGSALPPRSDCFAPEVCTSNGTEPEKSLDDEEIIEVKVNKGDDSKKISESNDGTNSACSGISCCICLDLMSKKDLAMINGCKHKFCFECIEKWADRENTCPLCKERFSKIERVYKAPRRKKKRKNPDDAPLPRNKHSKRVKNRSQRADYGSGSALQGLLQGMENGALPQGLAHFIFSNIPGGLINGFSRNGPPPYGRAFPSLSSAFAQYDPNRPGTRANNVPTTSETHGFTTRSAGVAPMATTTIRFSPGASYVPLAQQLETILEGNVTASRSAIDSFFEEDLTGDSDVDDLQPLIQQPSQPDTMPPWANPFETIYFRGGSAAVNGQYASRSYAANDHEATAGSSADNALEIVDSDDEDEIIEMVVAHT